VRPTIDEMVWGLADWTHPYHVWDVTGRLLRVYLDGWSAGTKQFDTVAELEQFVSAWLKGSFEERFGTREAFRAWAEERLDPSP
jgi:hypothetical protein